MMTMKYLNKFIAAAAAFSLTVAFPAEAFAAGSSIGSAGSTQVQESRTELIISDAEGLRQLSADCRTDTYSKGLYVTLTADIELSGDFTPIPVFCGTFDGAGHTVSGFSAQQDGSYSGLFRYIQRGGTVKNVIVKGTAAPGGSADYIGGIAGSNAGNITGCTFSGGIKGNEYIGGIAGINEKTGLISGCEASGAVSGTHYAGGIAGSNAGTIMNCVSRCSVNTSATEAKLSIQDIDWDSLVSSEEPSSMTDVGGISGFSDGIIQGCENYGTVGYQHIGYNVGGIVGRQSGYVYSCVNHGEVYGRKDVGGIAGQLEPYQSIDFDKDTVQRLLDEMDTLGSLTDKLISDAGAAGEAVDGKIQGMTWQMEQLRKSADDISDRTENIYNGWADGLNEISARVDQALDGVSPALDDFRDGLELLSQFSDSLAEVFDQITVSGDDMKAALESAEQGVDILNGAISGVSAALDDISLAAGNLSSAMGDTDKTEAAVKDILKALNSANGEVKNIASALSQIGKACDELEEWVTGRDFERLSDGIADLSDAMQDVTRALSKMSAALRKISGSVDANEIQKGLDGFSDASEELGKAAIHAAAAVKALSGTIPDADSAKKELSEAADNLTAAGRDISSAADAIKKAVDSDALADGISGMKRASDQLSSALSEAEDAIEDITEAYKKISSSRVPENTYDDISTQLKKLNAYLTNISGAADRINAAVDEISGQIDSGMLKDSIQAAADAAEKLSNAADEIVSSGDAFDQAADSIQNVIDSMQNASSSASDASGYLADACSSFSEAADKLSETIKLLGDKPAVEFPAGDAEFSAAVDSFSNNFAGITSAVSAISSTAKNQGDILLEDVNAITDEFGVINDILQELKDKVMNREDSDGFTTDTSDDDSSVRQGKALSCTNYGVVQGDLNVGGIAGSMAIDFDFDPEDDIVSDGEHSLSFSYKIRDIIESCTNTGEITAKKNYCGGIVGKQDMGVVRGCVQNGKVSSTGGSYAGGIAGSSSSAIRNCISKVTVSASGYVGGIAGQGLILTDNAAILDAYDYTECVGAVAGWVDFSDENTEVLRNSFVDRGIAAVDGISYSGKASAVSFDEYRKIAGSVAVIDVKFMVDGELMDTIQVDYAGRLRVADFPEIPEKDGCFSRWSEFDNECITFPVVVEAVYTPYVTLIESGEKSESGFALVLADGLFDDGSTVSVSTQSSSVFPPDNDSELRIIKIDSSTSDSASQLRLLKPEGRGTVNVMQFVNGAWKNVDFSDNGHYLLVKSPMLENGSGTYCVQLQSVEIIPVVIIGICILVAVVNIVLWTIIIRKKRAAKKEAEAEKV